MSPTPVIWRAADFSPPLDPHTIDRSCFVPAERLHTVVFGKLNLFEVVRRWFSKLHDQLRAHSPWITVLLRVEVIHAPQRLDPGRFPSGDRFELRQHGIKAIQQVWEKVIVIEGEAMLRIKG